LGWEKWIRGNRSKNIQSMNAYSYVGVILAIILAGAAVIIQRRSFVVPRGHCGLLYRHGKSLHRISPGRHHFWKRGYTVRFVDMRKTQLAVVAEEVLNADHIGFKATVLLTYQIIQAETVAREVGDHELHLHCLALGAVRSVLASTSEATVVSEDPEIAERLLAYIGPKADRAGIVIHGLEANFASVSESRQDFVQMKNIQRTSGVLVTRREGAEEDRQPSTALDTAN
jgi:hypothetical protein